MLVWVVGMAFRAVLSFVGEFLLPRHKEGVHGRTDGSRGGRLVHVDIMGRSSTTGVGLGFPRPVLAPKFNMDGMGAVDMGDSELGTHTGAWSTGISVNTLVGVGYSLSTAQNTSFSTN
jgi:hypothetical protein